MELGAFSVSLAVKDIHASKTFYEKLGFARMNTAMAIFQNQEQAVARGYLQGDGSKGGCG